MQGAVSSDRGLLWVLMGVGVWLGLCYALRLGLMEAAHWVGDCAALPELLACEVRAGLGKVIHFQLLAYAALLAAGLSAFWPGKPGRILALLALAFGIPALVLYTASLAAFALVIAGLRLVR